MQFDDEDGLVALRDLQISNHLPLPYLISWGSNQHVIVFPQFLHVLLRLKLPPRISPSSSIVKIFLVSVSVVFFRKFYQTVQQVKNGFIFVGKGFQNRQFFILILSDPFEPGATEKYELELSCGDLYFDGMKLDSFLDAVEVGQPGDPVALVGFEYLDNFPADERKLGVFLDLSIEHKLIEVGEMFLHQLCIHEAWRVYCLGLASRRRGILHTFHHLLPLTNELLG